MKSIGFRIRSATPRQARLMSANGDKTQSPGSIARSSSANELALRKKTNMNSKKKLIFIQ